MRSWTSSDGRSGDSRKCAPRGCSGGVERSVERLGWRFERNGDRLARGNKVMWRRIVPFSDLVLVVVLVAAAYLWWPRNRTDAEVGATLAGALFGGAAVLLGNWINRWNEQQRAAEVTRRAAEDLERRRYQLKSLIAAELSDVAAGLLGALQFATAARAGVLQRGGPLPVNMSMHLPRAMPFTFSLGEGLWVLEPLAINALATVRANLTVLRSTMEDVTAGEGAGWSDVNRLLNTLRHTMVELAKAFDQIAPAHMLRAEDKPPERASLILRRAAAAVEQPTT
jgi:hypothetical protein